MFIYTLMRGREVTRSPAVTIGVTGRFRPFQVSNQLMLDGLTARSLFAAVGAVCAANKAR